MKKDIRRTVVDAIIINPDEGWILLTRKNNKWILPWGKIDNNETDIEALSREIHEELDWKQLNLDNITPYKEFYWTTPFSNKEVIVKTYFADLLALVISDEDGIKTSAEIEEARYVGDFSSIDLSEITKDIIETLLKDWYL